MLFLVRLLTFLGVFWVLQRLLRLFVVKKAPAANPRPERSAPPTDTVRDPVCGMYMDPRLAIRLENGKESFYFCSEECQRKFLAMPRS